ncbi:MAG: hypothetical protein ACRD2C_23990 [Acidimicrobiales bacterium]
MNTTTRTNARQIRRPLIAATTAAIALALVTSAWPPSGRPDASVAAPQHLTDTAAANSGRANLRWAGEHSSRRLRTEAPYTLPLGINNRGHIVGSTFDALEGATAEAHGFLLRDGADGRFTPIDIPGAIIGTNATGINDRGQIVGRYGNPDATTAQPAPDMMPTDTASAIAEAPARDETPP